MTQDQAKKIMDELAKKIMDASNNVGVGNSKELDVLLEAGAVLQEYLNK